MRWHDHSRLEGYHALLSPSKPAWLNYDEDKIDAMVGASIASRRGTDLHELAQRMINLGVRLPKTTETLNQYVNDAIGYRMKPEQILFYSPNCYGQADALSFNEIKMMLRVHDLKTGVTRSTMTQLKVYAALFCLEYGHNPTDLLIELRIYQNDDVQVEEADPTEIMVIMDRIKIYDLRIEVLKKEVYG